MSALPLVTVVTITYNLIKDGREKFVRQCIESVKNQTYPNIEHIIIDGASADGTLEIFKDYPWLQVYSEPDSGIYDAMNKGVSHANGKYIAFLNSDDFWHDNRAVEVSVKALEENNADFSYAPCTYIDKNEDFLGYWYPTIETFFAWMPFCHQTMFTKTKLVKFDSKYKSSGDFDFLLKLILDGAKGIYVSLNFTTFRFIGMSSGLTKENPQGSVSYVEHRNSMRENLHKKFGISIMESDTIYNFRRINRTLLQKIANSVNIELSNNINDKLLSKRGCIIELDIIPKPRKIQVLFNARDLNSEKSLKVIKFLSTLKDCKIVLYVESDVKIPEQYEYLERFEGRMRDIDAFCSPISPVPSRILQTNIPILNYGEMPEYCLRSNIKNIYLKGSYKIKLKNFTLFKVIIDHGVIIYLLFKFIPLLKIISKNGINFYYLFNIFKLPFSCKS